MTKKRLLLIDAHALIHRAFHALPPLTTKSGQPVHAVYGFLLILMKALKDLKPDYVVVAFDSKGKTFREEKFAAYKAQRPETAPELVSQFPLVRTLVEAFGFPLLAQVGYEADDIIGTVCARVAKEKNLETIIVTGDLDLLQLVNDHTKVLKLMKGVKDTLLYDPTMVKEKHSFTPEQVVEYKGLRGDTSDNIPGVKGVGEKTAADLLQKYQTIENIYAHLDEIEGRARKALEGHQDDAALSKELATIVTDADIDFDLDRAAIGKYDQKTITDLFQQYEFKSLMVQLKTLPGFEEKKSEQRSLFTVPQKQASAADTKKRAQDLPAAQKKSSAQYHLVRTEKEIAELAKKLSQQKIFAFDTETTGLDAVTADLVGISFSWRADEGWYLACGAHVPPAIAAVMENPNIHKTGHNVKFDMESLHHAGVVVRGVVFDTMIASYLLNSASRGHGLDHLAFVEFGYQMQPIEELIGKGKQQITMDNVDVEQVAWYAAEDADFSWRLYELFSKRLGENPAASRLLSEMEIPLIDALMTMEEKGVMIDEVFLKEMSKKLHRRIRTIEEKIHTMAGGEFNVASPIQLKDVLFNRMKISTEKLSRTKTGISTAASELEKLRGVHPIIDLISEYRELAKLTSTYIDALPQLVNAHTGRIHTSYNQTIAATGRLSSTDPNLQNIPIRTDLGNEIRKAFVPERGKVLLSADYSQIELRVVAHLAQDAVMKKAFTQGEDIHVRTAAELNDVPLADVTPQMRREAKAINFGILYGMGVGGIMRDSGASREDARAFLEKYFQIHSGIKQYLDDVRAAAHTDGYTETLFGRRRPVPEINSSNRMIAAGAERAAVNMPIQGTAADLMKIAMLAVHKEIADGRIHAEMLLQVHDELVFEIDADRVMSEAKKIKRVMENAYELSVPLVVEIEAGPNWGDLTNILT